jgi:5,10-methylenetetrahydrofolate reductase
LVLSCSLYKNRHFNRISKAKPHIDNLKQLKPDFKSKASYLISRFVKEEELVEHVMEGLRKAGMTIK